LNIPISSAKMRQLDEDMMNEITDPKQEVVNMEMPKNDAKKLSEHLLNEGYDVLTMSEEGKMLTKLAISHKNNKMMKQDVLEQQFRMLKNKSPLPYAMSDYGRPHRY
jgi:protein-tyrosine-phosphatase